MSRASFESIYAALFALTANVPGITAVSRRLQPAQDVPPQNCPALFQVQGPQKAVYNGEIQTAWELNVMWVVVVVQTNPAQPMTPTLNPILDGIAQALAPANPMERQTLGGLVDYCAIEGNVDISEGDMGDRAVAFVPIRIVVPGF